MFTDAQLSLAVKKHRKNLVKIRVYYPKLSKKILKSFLIEDYFHLPPVSKTPLVHLELWISPRIFKKEFKAVLMVYSGAWGKLIHEINLKSKIPSTVPLNVQSILFFLCKNPLINKRLAGGTHVLGNYCEGPWEGSILSHSEPVFVNV